jgi:hypothetical protein
MASVENMPLTGGLLSETDCRGGYGQHLLLLASAAQDSIYFHGFSP